MLFRIRWIRGSLSFSITVLSSSVSPPSVCKDDLLAEPGREIADEALEFAEGGADREHPDAHRVVPELRGEPLHLFGHLDERQIAGPGGQLAQAGLDGHQLPHHVDQAVELGRGDPDAGGRFRGLALLPFLADVLLLDERRLNLVGGHQPRLDEDLSDPLMGAERLLDLVERQVPPLDEDLSQLLVSLVLIEPPCFVDDVDFQFAGILDEDEDVLDGIDIPFGGQDDIPVGVADLRIDLARSGIRSRWATTVPAPRPSSSFNRRMGFVPEAKMSGAGWKRIR